MCELQNSARHDRLVALETENRFVSLSDQQDLLTAAREKYDDFREVPQDFQNHALRRTDKAFANFRRRCKENACKKGYPRYKKRVRSLTWSLRKYTKVVRKKSEDTDKQTIRIRENPIRETAWKHNLLKVPKLGEVKIYMHRPLRGDPKEVTLVKKASGWYAHISCDIEDTAKVEPTEAIGVDMGTAHYLTTSESEKVENPRRRLRHSKDLSRKKKGSNIAKQRVYCESMYCHRKLGPPPKPRLCYNDNLSERSIRWRNEEDSLLSLKHQLFLRHSAVKQAELCRRHNLSEDQVLEAAVP